MSDLSYILDSLPQSRTPVKTVEHQGNNLHVVTDEKGKRIAYAEVYLNGSKFPTFVQTRVPNWVK